MIDSNSSSQETIKIGFSKKGLYFSIRLSLYILFIAFLFIIFSIIAFLFPNVFSDHPQKENDLLYLFALMGVGVFLSYMAIFMLNIARRKLRAQKENLAFIEISPTGIQLRISNKLAVLVPWSDIMGVSKIIKDNKLKDYIFFGFKNPDNYMPYIDTTNSNNWGVFLRTLFGLPYKKRNPYQKTNSDAFDLIIIRRIYLGISLEEFHDILHAEAAKYLPKRDQ